MLKKSSAAVSALHARKLAEADLVISASFSADEAAEFIQGGLLTNYKWNLSQDVWDDSVTEEDKVEKTVVPKLLDTMNFHYQGEATEQD